MAFLSDNVLDSGLNYATTNGTVVHICSQQPATYAEATSTYTLGNKSGLTVGSPANGSPNGRAVTIPAITDGSVTGTGTATHWALVSGTVLIASNSLTASQSVTSGNTFTLDAQTIRIPDPA